MKPYLSIYYELRDEIPFADEMDLRRVAYARWKGLDVDKNRNVPAPKDDPPQKRKRRKKKRNVEGHSPTLRQILMKKRRSRRWVKRILYTPM